MFDDINKDGNGGSPASEGGTSSNPPAYKQNDQVGELIGETVTRMPAAPGATGVNSGAQAGTSPGARTPVQPQAAAPARTPATEDIFAKTEAPIPQSVPKPAVLKPKTPGMPPVSPEQIDRVEVADDGLSKKKTMLIIFLVLFVAVLAYGSYWTYISFFGTGAEETNIDPELIDSTVDDTSMQADETGKDNNQSTSLPPKIETPPDSDNDGLLDSEEESLGTDIYRVDSDDDGLYDREEVRVYKTDPLNPDTDGDGYLDGSEVDQNYNPLGPGKLYQLE